MIVEPGSRDLHLPGSHLNRDGKQGRPLLAHLGEPLATFEAPSLSDPIDETWMRLDPVPVGAVGEASFLVPITFATKVPDRIINERMHRPLSLSRRLMDPHHRPQDLIYTVGPFTGERFVQAICAHQHRRLSLTLASTDPDAQMRYRFFDMQLALDVDFRLLRGPAYWLDWYVHPIGTPAGETAVFVHDRKLERTA